MCSILQQELEITRFKVEFKTNRLKTKPDLEREPLKVLFVCTNMILTKLGIIDIARDVYQSQKKWFRSSRAS